MDDHLPDEPPPRPPIALAPLSMILLGTGTASDAAASIAAWKDYLATLNRPFELLLLPLATCDLTIELTDVRHIACDAERGIGPALQTAIQTAQYPLIVLATADRQYQPADLKQLLGVIDKVDIAVGCRCAARPAAWRQTLGTIGRVLGWLLIGLPLQAHPCVAGATPWRRRWIARWAFGVQVVDPESTFRLMRRAAAVRLVLQSRGEFALVEQLAKANHLEFIMAEEPVTWSPPATLPVYAAPFAQEVRELFRHPNFGPPELHTAQSIAQVLEKPVTPPTTPPSGSSERQILPPGGRP